MNGNVLEREERELDPSFLPNGNSMRGERGPRRFGLGRVRTQEDSRVSHHGNSADSNFNVENNLSGENRAKNASIIPPRASKYLPVTEELKTWIGIVLECGDKYFSAKLLDATGDSPELLTEFSINEVSESDAELLSPGSVFYWHIYQNIRKRGQRVTDNIIKFRRTIYTASDIEASEKLFEEISESGWLNEPAPNNEPQYRSQ